MDNIKIVSEGKFTNNNPRDFKEITQNEEVMEDLLWNVVLPEERELRFKGLLGYKSVGGLPAEMVANSDRQIRCAAFFDHFSPMMHGFPKNQHLKDRLLSLVVSMHPPFKRDDLKKILEAAYNKAK